MEAAYDSSELSPLEAFVREEIEAAGGMWDQVEPQVYDLLLPTPASASAADHRPTMLRVTFDPEALAEHPQAQLASLGTPVVDSLLAGAVERGRFVQLYLLGLNLRPQHLGPAVARALKLPPNLLLTLRQARPLCFPQLVLWFEATFVADQREQEVLPVAVDLCSGRQARHLDLLLNESRLSEIPATILPEAPGIGRAAAYRIAREQVLRSVTTLANMRARELAGRIGKQIARMQSYYDDLLLELEAQAARAAARGGEDDARFTSRRSALTQERDLRIAELRRKNALRTELRLLNALLIYQPKLRLRAEISERTKRSPGAPATLHLVWDALTEQLEAVACPSCRRPTFELTGRPAALSCPNCTAGTPQRP